VLSQLPSCPSGPPQRSFAWRYTLVPCAPRDGDRQLAEGARDVLLHKGKIHRVDPKFAS
jgi:hypothetical protein